MAETCTPPEPFESIEDWLVSPLPEQVEADRALLRAWGVG